MDLQIRVRKQILTCRQISIANSVNFVRAFFQFDDEWAGTEKHVIFSNGDIPSVEILLSEDQACVVPWEVLQKEGDLYVSVVGILGNIKITTKLMDAPIKVYASGELGGSTPNLPTPSIWDQISGVKTVIGTDEEPFDFSQMSSLSKLKVGLNQVSGVMLDAPEVPEVEEDPTVAGLYSSWLFNVQCTALDVPIEEGQPETYHIEMVQLTSIHVSDRSWTRIGYRISLPNETPEEEVDSWQSLAKEETSYVESITLDSGIDEDHLSISTTEEPIDPDNPYGAQKIHVLMNTKGIGRNSDLQTISKASLVAAVNEVYAQTGKVKDSVAGLKSTIKELQDVLNQPIVCLTGNIFNRYNKSISNTAVESLLTYDDSIQIASGSKPEIYGEILRLWTGTTAVRGRVSKVDGFYLLNNFNSTLYFFDTAKITLLQQYSEKLQRDRLAWAFGSFSESIFILDAYQKNKGIQLNLNGSTLSVTLDYYMSSRTDPAVFQRLDSSVAILSYSDANFQNPVWRVCSRSLTGSNTLQLPNAGKVDSIFVPHLKTLGYTYGWTRVEGDTFNFYKTTASSFSNTSGVLVHSEAYDSTARYSKFSYNEDCTKLYRYILRDFKYYLEERNSTTFEVIESKLIDGNLMFPSDVIERTCPTVFNGLLIPHTDTGGNVLIYYQLEGEKWVQKTLDCPGAPLPFLTSDKLFLGGSCVTVITKKKKYNLM